MTWIKCICGTLTDQSVSPQGEGDVWCNNCGWIDRSVFVNKGGDIDYNPYYVEQSYTCNQPDCNREVNLFGGYCSYHCVSCIYGWWDSTTQRCGKRIANWESFCDEHKNRCRECGNPQICTGEGDYKYCYAHAKNCIGCSKRAPNNQTRCPTCEAVQRLEQQRQYQQQSQNTYWRRNN